MSIKKKLFKSTLFGTITALINGVISLLQGTILANALKPIGFGNYTLSRIIIEFSNYVNFGILFSFDREYPKLIGEKKDNEALLLSCAVFKVHLILACILIIFGFLPYIFKFKFIAEKGQLFIASIGYASASLLLMRFSLSLVRAKGNFNLFSLSTLVSFISSLLLILIFREYLLVWSAIFIIGFGFNIAFIINLVKVKFIFKLIWNSSFSYVFLLKDCFALLAFNLGNTLFFNIDRLLGSRLLGSHEFGIYSFSFFLSKSLIIILAVTSSFLYPIIMGKAGAGYSEEYFYKNIKKLNLLLSIVIPYLLIIFYSFIGIVINKYFSLYTKSICYAYILAPVVFFLSLRVGNSEFFLAKYKQVKLLFITFLSICIFFITFFILNYVILDRILSLSVSILMSYFWYGIIVFYVFNKKFNSLRGILKNVFDVFFPLITLIIIVLLGFFIMKLFPSFDIYSSWFVSSFFCIFSIIVYTILIYYYLLVSHPLLLLEIKNIISNSKLSINQYFSNK